tara:strand:- start:14975 stop:15823 length:849 start_codon:yes stop_codon:yes gene_type:complete
MEFSLYEIVKDSLFALNPLMNLQDLLADRLKDRACINCGRRLTDPDSIKDGFGPVCRHKLVMKYARLQASIAYKPDEDDYLEIADIGLTKLPEADYVIVGNTPFTESLLATRNEHGDAIAVTWIDWKGDTGELNEDAMPWVDAVKMTFKTDTLHKCIHMDDELLGLMDTYWGPCQDIKKHDDAPKDGETWGQHYPYHFWEILDQCLMDWCEGFDWYEMLIDMIQDRRGKGKEAELLDYFLDYLVDRNNKTCINTWANYPDEAMEVAIGWGEDFHASIPKLSQ